MKHFRQAHLLWIFAAIVILSVAELTVTGEWAIWLAIITGALCVVGIFYAAIYGAGAKEKKQSFYFKLLPICILLKYIGHILALYSESGFYAMGAGYTLDSVGAVLTYIVVFKIFYHHRSRFHTRGLMLDMMILVMAALVVITLLFFEPFMDYLSATSNPIRLMPAANMIAVTSIMFGALILIMVDFSTCRFLLSLFIGGCLLLIKIGIIFIEHHYAPSITAPYSETLKQLYAASIHGSTAAIIWFFYKHMPISSFTHEDPNLYRVSPLASVSISALILSIPISLFTRAYWLQLPPIHTEIIVIITLLITALTLLRLRSLALEVMHKQTALKSASSHDKLTGLYSLYGLQEQLENDHSKTQNYLCLIEINNLQAINQKYGIGVGNSIICKIAEKLSHSTTADLATRPEGNQFLFVIRQNQHNEQGTKSYTIHIEREMRKLLSQLSTWHIVQDDTPVWTRCQLGISLYTPGDNFLEACRNSLIALNQAKLSKEAFSFYNTASSEQRSEQEIIETIERSIEQKDIELRFQPIYNLQTNRAMMIEALLRLRTFDDDSLSPHFFLPIVKKEGKITSLTLVLLERLSALLPLPQGACVSVNIDPETLENKHHRRQLINTLNRLDLPRHCIVFEVTEHEESDLEALQQAITEINTLGYGFALDDFGAGSASLSRVSRLPIQYLKLDISILRGAAKGQELPLKMATDMAHEMGIKVIAEGAESHSDIELLRTHDIDFAQGYYYGRPISIDALLKQDILG